MIDVKHYVSYIYIFIYIFGAGILDRNRGIIELVYNPLRKFSTIFCTQKYVYYA